MDLILKLFFLQFINSKVLKKKANADLLQTGMSAFGTPRDVRGEYVRRLW